MLAPAPIPGAPGVEFSPLIFITVPRLCVGGQRPPPSPVPLRLEPPRRLNHQPPALLKGHLILVRPHCYHKVKPWGQHVLFQPECLAQQSFDPVPPHRPANPLPH